MRIGIFTQCYHPTNNGVVTSIDSFKKELEKRGHEIFIFTAEFKGYKDENPSHVFRFPAFFWFGQPTYPIALPYLAPSQIAEIYDMNLDIVHAQHPFTMGKLGLNVGRYLDIPVVYTYHTLIAEYNHYFPVIGPLIGGLTKKYLIGHSRRFCNACDQVVTPSKSMQKVLRNYGVSVPIEVIPTGVELENFANPFHPDVLRSKWGIGEYKKILLYVSRIAREKNLDFLFDAIRELARKRDDFHLLMVGGGPQLEYYHNQVRHWELESTVTFTGQQEKKQANRFFGAADIFVFPSITETQGIVITEALAAGIPAVAVNKMGPSEIINDGVDGFLVPLKVEEFTDKIELLLDNSELRQRMGRQARENAKQFSAQVSADKMEKLYERTVESYNRTQ